MKKILSTIFFGLFAFTQASAEVGVNVGISGNLGLFAASAKEVNAKTYKGSEHGAAGWGSIFVEKTLGDRLAIGVDYVPTALETDQVETAKHDKTSSATASSVTNKVQVDFEDLTTVYVAVNLSDSMYVKAGLAMVDVITNESLGTGSKYGNADLDGAIVGFGTNKTLDNGMFIRTEASYMTFDGASITSGDNTVTLNQLDGVTAKLAIGKSF